MAEDQQTLDLMKPGKMWAAASDFSKLTFHLLLNKPEYSKDKVGKDPASIKAADQLMPPWDAPAAAANADGVIEFDLSQRSDVIIGKIVEQQDKGTKVDKVKAVVIAHAKDGNKIPEKSVAEVMEFKVKPVPVIKLKHTNDKDPLRTHVTVPPYKEGVAAFLVELNTNAVEGVRATVAPRGEVFYTEKDAASVAQALKNNPSLQKVKQLMQQLSQAEQQRSNEDERTRGWSDANPPWRVQMLNNEANLRKQITAATLDQARTAMGNIGAQPAKEFKVQDGKKYTLVIPVPFAVRSESKTENRRRPYVYIYNYKGHTWYKPAPGEVIPEAAMRVGWRSAGNGDFVQAQLTRDVWEGGDFTLTVQGTGGAAAVKDSAKLRAESWGADWLWAMPPKPFAHNAC